MNSWTPDKSRQPLPVSILTGSPGGIRAAVRPSATQQPVPGRTHLHVEAQLAGAVAG